jgi:hypothetical protein
MRWLREKFFVHALELLFNPLDLLPRRAPLRLIQFQDCPTGQPPLRAIHHGGDHLQIADQFGGWP